MSGKNNNWTVRYKRLSSNLSSLLLLLLAINLISFPIGGQAQIVFSDPNFVAETVATLPVYTAVGLTFDNAGRIFIWEKPGVVRIVKNGVLLPTPFIDIQSQVNICADRGLLGLALDPNFSTNGYVYLFYSVEQGGNSNDCGAKISRLIRVTADPANPDTALAGSAVTLIDNIPSDSNSHSIGTLRFAPDGKLFVSHGDGAGYNAPDVLALRAQDLNSYNGKILRINPDGSAPGDNPFDDGTNSVRSKVWAYGLRNPFRYALNPVTGEPYIGDVGYNTWEEIDRGRGSNFGWPCYEGNAPQPDYQAAFPTQCGAVLASAVTPPLYTYDHTVGVCVIGGSFYTGVQYPAQYRGNLFFADYGNKWIKRLIFDASYNVTAVVPFATGVDGPVDIEMGPDGMLYYVAILTGEVGRIRYTSNLPPIAKASAVPSSGYSPLTVNFSSSGSQDQNGGPLTFLWDFGDGATSSSPNPQHIYTTSGVVTYPAKLTVTNSSAATASAVANVTVGSLPPVAAIDTPIGGTLVTVGQTVTYHGSATDPDDGVLPPSALSWLVLLHHNDHVHVYQTGTGSGGSFLVTDHGVGNFSYEIILTATDSSGLTNTKSVVLPMPSVGLPDIVAAYSFNEGLGTVAGDSSGSGNNGAITNALWTNQGYFGNALVFDGVTSFVSVPDSTTLGLGSTGSMEAWVNLAGLNKWHGVISKGNADASSAQNYGLEVDYLNRVLCILGNGTTGQDLYSTTTMNAGQFHHLACTWDGTTFSLYIDGVLNASAPQTVTPLANTSPLGIGQYGGNTDRLKGTVDEVRIYNRALSQAEVQSDMTVPIVTAPSGPANTAPTISSITAQATNENVPTGAVAFTVGDAETAAGSLAVSGISNNTALVPNGNIVFGGSGASRTVTITPASNQSGTATITVTVSDGQASTPTSFLLTVNAVNQAPTISSITDQATTTGAPLGPISFAVGDVDNAVTSLAVTASSANQAVIPNANIVISGTGASRTLMVTPLANKTGVATITLTVSDGQLSTSVSFHVTVSTIPVGLMAAFPLNEGSGLTTVDASDHANTGALLNGPVWTTGQYGNALLFDGVNDFVSVPDSATLAFGNTGTIEAWVKLTNLNRWHGVIAKGSVDASSASNYGLEITNLNLVICSIGNGATGLDLTSTITINAGQFHHLACTWSGTTLALYIDGVLNASMAQAITPLANNSPLSIGQYGGNVDRLAGVIDEVRLYNRSLSQAEIQSDMNSPITPPLDSDGDGVPDYRDNCIFVANSNQRDTDGDGYGNLCDADLNNSGGVVNFADLALFKSSFGGSNPNADFNGDGVVNFADLAIFKQLFGKVPGPSGLTSP